MPPGRFFSLALGAVAALCSVLVVVWSRYRGPRSRGAPRSIPLEWRGHFQEVRPSTQQVLVLGLDGAGKTSILQKMCTNNAGMTTSPTQGFNTVCVTAGSCSMRLLEVGGSLNLRTYWNLYLKKAAVLVFVLDSANHQRLILARQELHRLLDEAHKLPLVVLANKQDQADAVSVSEMHQHLALHRVDCDRKVTVLGTSATAEEQGATHSILDVKALLVDLIS